MTQPRYWLCLFNPTTWQEFLAAGGHTAGFPLTRWKTVQRIQPGDVLLGYLTGSKCWIAALKVVSEPKLDETPIWSGGVFPCRLAVEAIAQRDPDQGVPVLSLKRELRLFDGLKVEQHWGVLFRFAPREIDARDGALIVQVLAAPPS